MGTQEPLPFTKMGPSSIFCGKAANSRARIIPVHVNNTTDFWSFKKKEINVKISGAAKFLTHIK